MSPDALSASPTGALIPTQADHLDIQGPNGHAASSSRDGGGGGDSLSPCYSGAVSGIPAGGFAGAGLPSVSEEDDTFPNMRDYSEASGTTAALTQELDGTKARHEVTFQTLRTIFCLDRGATWADVLERSEELVQHCLKETWADAELEEALGGGAGASADDASSSPGHCVDEATGETLPSLEPLESEIESSAAAVQAVGGGGGTGVTARYLSRRRLLVDAEVLAAREEARQADLECERLDEQLEAQSARIAQLRELLQRQQKLLDLTSHQIENQDAQNQRQAEALAELEAREAELRIQVATQEVKIQVLVEENAGMQEDLKRRHSVSVKQEMELSESTSLVRDLETDLERTREELATSNEASQQHEAEAGRQQEIAETAVDESERRRIEVAGLVEKLLQQGEHVEKLRCQLQVFESAQRRNYSYFTRPPTGDVRQRAFTGGAGTASVPALIGIGNVDHRHVAGDETPGSASASGAGTGAVTPAELSTGCYPSARFSASGQFSHRSSAAPSHRGSVASPGPPMDDEERDAFLSHFPMASRTERLMRDRMEERRRFQSNGSDAIVVSSRPA